jgi:hypothetical protein
MEQKGLLMLLAVIAVTAALVNTVITYNKISDITGMVTDTGNVSLEVTSVADVNFTTATVAFGSGAVTAGKDEAYLDTLSGTVTDGNWSVNSAGLVLENNGNVDLKLYVGAGKAAAAFIGGTGPAYKWLFTESEAGSCTEDATLDTFVDVNTTGDGTLVCTNFSYDDNGADELTIHFNITVPKDATKGKTSDIITATASAI